MRVVVDTVLRRRQHHILRTPFKSGDIGIFLFTVNEMSLSLKFSLRFFFVFLSLDHMHISFLQHLRLSS